MLDYSKIKKKLVPPVDGQAYLRLSVGTVSAIDSDGTVDITMDGATVPNVPVLGRSAFAVGSVVQVLKYRGSMLIIGPSGAAFGGPAANTYGSTDTSTTASTTFVTSLTGGTNQVTGRAFIAPPSGQVAVIARSAASNATAGDYAIMDFQVRQGSTLNAGTIVRAANENTAGLIRSSTAGLQATVVSSDLVTGLTPGAAYNVTLAFHIGGTGTASFNRRHVLILPQ